MKTNATIEQLQQAMKKLNKTFPLVDFENVEQITSGKVKFTLRAKSGEKGSRVSHSGRRLPKASWHAHGTFFDILFTINPNAYVDSLGKRITINSGNWEDRQIGSRANPIYFSETSIS